jgi:hypothetical protein
LFLEFLNLMLLLLDLPLQIFPTWRRCGRMTTHPRLLVPCAPSGSRIHPPYVSLFRNSCSAKSVTTLELSQKQGGEQIPQMDYVPQEWYAQTAEFLANYHRAREILEAICEINRELLRRREVL